MGLQKANVFMLAAGTGLQTTLTILFLEEDKALQKALRFCCWREAMVYTTPCIFHVGAFANRFLGKILLRSTCS